jgi:OCT family organic cation transporter-like MFS transporter 4/5
MQEILKYIGNWGKYQVFIYVICFVPFMLSGSLTLVSTFTAGVPNTRCFVPDYDNDSTNYATPFDPNNDVSSYLFPPAATDTDAQVYCYYCDPSMIGQQNCTKESATNKCPSFIYDTSQYKTTIVSLFNMVCDDVWMSELLQSMFMVGVFFGAGIFGVLGDKIGRRKTFLIGGLLSILSANVVPFATNYYAYVILQVIVGAVQVGTYLTAFIVVMELFGGLPKTIFGIWVQGIFSIGYIYVGVMAYFIRDWQWLTWSVSFITVLYIPLYWFFPESIRWLVQNNKPEEARKMVEKAAKWNGVVIPEDVLERELAVPEKVEQASVFDLFKHKQLAIMTLIVWFTWLVDSMTYYGLSYNTSSLPGNVYVNFIVSGLVELPAYVICIPLMENVGRRYSLVGFLFIGGTSCIASGFITQKYVKLLLTFLGKLCVSAAYAITYNYSAEVFPTVVRNAGTGFSSLMARIGSISAPQIALLAQFSYSWLPVVIYGSFGVVASFLDLFLPETKGRQMPESMEDGLKLASDKRRSSSNLPILTTSSVYGSSEGLKF